MKLLSMRNLHLWHRWLGIGLGILVLLWFISGVVMLFVAYPKLTQEERLVHQAPVALELVKVSPAQVAATLEGEPDKIRLSMHQGRPVYHVLHQKSWHSIWADSGQALDVTPEMVRHSAQVFLPDVAMTATTLVTRDQWSISSSLHPHRPLHRVDFANGDSLYLSSHTGEVVLDTTRCERAWNWLGSVIHWIYFTPLRADYSQAWRQVVMWLSLPATVMSIMGIWLGVGRLRIRRRYKGGRMTPYHGWAKWHHVSGMLAGILCFTWLLSGWLSMNPFNVFSEGRRLTSDSMQTWEDRQPASQLPGLPAQLHTTDKIREIEWLYFGGKAYLLGLTPSQSHLFDIESGDSLAPLSRQILVSRAARMMPGSNVKATTLLEYGDQYYYGKRLEQLSPVLRIDMDDDASTSYYIDPATTRIVATQNTNSRSHRWLFSALHRLDFAPLSNADLPRWIIVILFSIGGSILTLAGMVMGWRRLTRA